MPLLTLADFIVEQAVTIAIGAVAVAVAPKAGPKLAQLGGDLSAKTKSKVAALPLASGAAAATASGAETVRTNALAAGQGISRSVTGGAAWFGRQWSDLLDEAIPDGAAADIDPASVLGAASAVNVASFAPGRARLRLQRLRGQPILAAEIAATAAALDGIDQVQAKPSTGSLVVLFEPDVYPTAELLVQALRVAQH